MKGKKTEDGIGNSRTENKKLLVEMLKLARLLLVAAAIAGIFIVVSDKYRSAKEPEITSSFINGKLEAASDLTSSELSYRGLVRYSKGSIPFLTQNSFSMMYTASVRAGVDLANAQVSVTKGQVEVTLPECEVQSIEVDPDSIEFYDEHWALFNWTEKTDVIDTLSAAREDVSQKADINSLLEHAKKQAEAILRGLLEGSIGDRELVVRHQGRN